MNTITKNIFLADDDPDDIFFFEYALNNICPECRLNTSLNGQELLDKVCTATIRPDLIFLDINMPIMNGMETLSMIKQNPLLGTIPIIIYSTSRNEIDIEKAFEIGASNYMIKPSDLDCLTKMLSQVLAFDWNNFTVPKKIEEFVINV